MDQNRMLELAREVLRIEAQAITALEARVGEDFAAACGLCLDCAGRLIVTGMGKSGHIGRKLAATLASTGSPAFFLHPAEAQHGDLGMVTRNDVLIALSNSGETQELVGLLPVFKRLGLPIIAMTGRRDSTLGRHADAVLDVSVSREACPLNLAPTASTTASLAMGDALALALLAARGVTAEDFAQTHPSGALGRRLLLRVGDLMHTASAVPRVTARTPLSDALVTMTEKGLGLTSVVAGNDEIVGIFTDGDLRRAMDRRADPHSTAIEQVMTRAPKTVDAQMLASEALLLMERHRISALLVADEQKRLAGVINIHDLMRAGVV